VTTIWATANGPVSVTALGATSMPTTAAGGAGSASRAGSAGQGRGRVAVAAACWSMVATANERPAAPVEASKNRTRPSAPPTATSAPPGWKATV
jgi:hypothetical protein